MARVDPNRLAMNRLAATVMQPNLPGFMVPTDHPQFHLATILDHDAGRNESSATLNDFDSPTVSRLPVLRPYTASDVPQAGDLVQLVQLGSTLAVWARQWRPTGTVTF